MSLRLVCHAALQAGLPAGLQAGRGMVLQGVLFLMPVGTRVFKVSHLFAPIGTQSYKV